MLNLVNNSATRNAVWFVGTIAAAATVNYGYRRLKNRRALKSV